MNLKTHIPQWLKNYRKDTFSSDLVAALIVTMLLVPQGLAYAVLAGLPAEMGLYASLLPLVAYAFFGTSMVMSVGPVAVASLMTAAALTGIAEPGSADYINAAIVLAALSGLMLFVFGLFRLGALAHFLSHPVISGFISGAALLIIIGQLRPLLGISSHGESAVQMLAGILAALDTLNPLTSAMGVFALLTLLAAKRWLAKALSALGLSAHSAALVSKLAPMLIVIASIVLVTVMGWENQLAVVGVLPAGLPSPVLPSVSVNLISQLWLPALAIGLIGFIESVSIAQAFAQRSDQVGGRHRIDANAELRGLGAANLVSAFSGAFPVTGGFSRTAVNAEAGARSPLSGVLAAMMIALVLLFATGFFRVLPNTVLAATIIAAAIGLVDIKTLRHSWHYDRAEGFALLGTAAGVLFAGVEVGIFMGIGLSLATLVWRASRPHTAILGRVPGTQHFRNVLRYQVETRPEILMLRVDENLFFGNAEAVEQRILGALRDQPETLHLVVLMSSVSSIDATALEMLDNLNSSQFERGVTLHLAEVKGPVMDRLEHEGFPKRLKGQIFLSANQSFEELSRK